MFVYQLPSVIGRGCSEDRTPNLSDPPCTWAEQAEKGLRKRLLWELAAEIRLACPNVVNAKGMWVGQ